MNQWSHVHEILPKWSIVDLFTNSYDESIHRLRGNTMKTTVQGAQIYYNERGTGTPTMFLHGVPDSAEMWNPIIERLQASYRCIALDLPGLTTRSEIPSGFDYKLPSMAKFIDEFVTA